MRTEAEVEEFRARAYFRHVILCRKCEGRGRRCSCREQFEYALEAYESCVPRQFWYVKDDQVKHNRQAFDLVIRRYVANFRRALKHGYGLLLTGDNGTGKTMFCSYVIVCALRASFTAYYTTMPQLDLDIKAGFNDAERQRRLSLMLTSDFVVIDELGKERVKASNRYMDAQLERVFKERLDDSMPVIFATNLSLQHLHQAYGPTVKSMLQGRFYTVCMEPGDYRRNQGAEMVREMGYDKPDSGSGV